jgi:transcriptional regulator of arginine metabolism
VAKLSRQNAILELVQRKPVASQEDLQRALGPLGYKVGQATLSRDIHELGLVKTVHGYSLSPANTPSVEPALSVARLVREFVMDVRPAQNLLVVKTAVGSAQPVAAALDGEDWPEVVGSVGGDDTILIICPDKKSATRLANRLRDLLA